MFPLNFLIIKTIMNTTNHATLYEERFCTMLIEHMNAGYSFESFGCIVNVSRTTLYKWSNAHPEFKEAKEIGEVHQQYFYERIGIDALLRPMKGFNASLWKFQMAARFQRHKRLVL
jgi:hypothetical protein